MPRAPKKCGHRDCATRVTAQRYCAGHEREHRDRSSWGRGSTRESRRTREQVLAMWPHCYLREKGCTITSTEDDHIIPRSQGGGDELTNRRGACASCHRRKSQREAQRRS